MSQKQTTMSHDDNDFDFVRLEKELKLAVQADEKYTRENDAKMRAVQQKVGSYEEFRDIVKASHLKPLDKIDKIDGKFMQPWNMHAEKGQQQEKKEAVEVKKKDEEVPKTGQEFVREWRKRSKEERYNFLLFVGADRLEVIFKTEIGFGLLGEFVQILESFKEADELAVIDILAACSRTNRFSLSVTFFSSKEKEACSKLFAKFSQEADIVDSLKHLYGVKSEKLKQ